MSEEANKPESAEHAFILMEASEVLISYGNFHLASQKIESDFDKAIKSPKKKNEKKES